MKRLFLACLALLPALATPAPLQLKAVGGPPSVGSDGRGQIRLALSVTPGWHTFPGNAQTNAEGAGPAPLSASFAPGSALRVDGPLRSSPTHRQWDEGFQMEVAHLGSGDWVEVPFRAAGTLEVGDHHAALQVEYQVCNGTSCRPPALLEIPVAFHVATPLSLPEHSVVPPVATSAPPARSRHWWSFLWLAMAAGAGALLTPCVFPMVPITVSFFAQRAGRRGHSPLRGALLYGAGIVGTFTGLGLLLAVLFGASGVQAFATSPLVNLALAGLFVLFALNLFGAFELRLPSWILNFLGTRAHGESPFGILMMGLTFSLTSFTCTVPFVGSALVSASRGQWFQPVVGMIGFSTVFALPFVLLALFPSTLSRLPKAGGWMARMKGVLGFVELAAALKFFSNADLAASWNLVSREFFLAACMACAGLIACYLLGLFRLPADSEAGPVGGGRALGAALFASLVCFFGGGLLGRPVGEWESFLPPAREERPAFTSTPSPGEIWMEDFPKALEAARRAGKPLFIDFTGTTCTNCRWMERNMFPRPGVARRLDGFIRVRLYTDRRTEGDAQHRRLQQERFGSIELPLYALLSPEGELLGTASFTRDEATFTAFLDGAQKVASASVERTLHPSETP